MLDEKLDDILDSLVGNPALEAINAGTQLLYASDWPHWDFDVPGRIAGLPFLSEQEKRNILGENARRVFRL